ncbi:integrase core domain-containing protein [Pantoea anthophila]|uniref:integrase core domain-containing protein n=1 Tax=Pantoea anthophila TaxID=470931 RepID=UPI003AFA3596
MQPGKSKQNGFIKSLTTTFVVECLNEHGFRNLLPAWKMINDRRQNYNDSGICSSLNKQTPAEFKAGRRS